MTSRVSAPDAAPAPVLRVSDGGVVLGGRPVLRGIDLRVDPGEVVTVLGANGSGKSTLVRALLGLVPLRSGTVELFGTPIGRFRDWRRIGFVPQRASVATGIPASVGEVVASGRLAHRRPLQPMRRVDRQAVRAALSAVGLSDRARERVSRLSGGQHQRVLIARALAGEPDLLVLDEATAGVDLPSQESFAALLGRLVDRGTTLLLVAHELGPLEPLVRRTVVMRDGRIAYDGAPLTAFRDVPGAHDHHPPAYQAPPDAYVDVGTTINRATDPAERP